MMGTPPPPSLCVPHQKDLPDVVAATAHSFGVDLDADIGNISSNLNLGGGGEGARGSVGGGGGGGGGGSSRGGGDGGDGGRKSRKLFRKLAAALVQGLRSETSDVWELGIEAARLWPTYLKMAEDGYGEQENMKPYSILKPRFFDFSIFRFFCFSR